VAMGLTSIPETCRVIIRLDIHIFIQFAYYLICK